MDSDTIVSIMFACLIWGWVFAFIYGPLAIGLFVISGMCSTYLIYKHRKGNDQ